MGLRLLGLEGVTLRLSGFGLVGDAPGSLLASI